MAEQLEGSDALVIAADDLAVGWFTAATTSG
jgi:hypothetical protein